MVRLVDVVELWAVNSFYSKFVLFKCVSSNWFWSWKGSVTCGPGIQMRKRTCLNGQCEGLDTEIKACIKETCQRMTLNSF